MKHFRVEFADKTVVHTDDPEDESFSLCGLQRWGHQKPVPQEDNLQKANKINCPRCIAIITYCRTSTLQEFN